MSNTPIPHNTDNVTELSVTETEKEIWKERINLYVKDECQLQYQLNKMNSIIWGKVSDELRSTVKSISGFSSAVDKFDTIGMLKLIHKTMSNVQSRTYFTAAVHMVKRIFKYRVQEKVSTVKEYYERFKNNMEVMEQLGIHLGADHGIVEHILTERVQSRYGLQPAAITKATDKSIELYQANAFLLGSNHS